MSRSYRSVRPKIHWLYTSADVMNLFGICANTLANWIKSGLRFIQGYEQHIFLGAELVRFHQQRALPKKEKKVLAEFDCYTCNLRVVPEVETVVLIDEAVSEQFRHSWAQTTCPNCPTPMKKYLNKSDCNKLRICVETNTSLLTINEEYRAVPAGIGINQQIHVSQWNDANELILFEYQKLLRGSAPETAHARLAAIRKFDSSTRHKSFSKLTKDDVAAYRDYLVSIGLGKNEERRSRSTIRHQAWHIRELLDWLIKQNGFKRLDKTLAMYIKLPRSQTAKALQPEPRAVMSDADLDLILKSYPIGNRTNRRDRAIIASSFLFGTRTDTTASLRIGDVDIQNQTVRVNATQVRVKGHRSMIIYWFPIHKMLDEIVTSWVQELYALGAKPDDALFPLDEYLLHKATIGQNSKQIIPTWKTDEPVRRAFRNGCKFSGISYFNPHSAKHYIKSVGEKVCLNSQDRKAWSLNMGHKNEQTTEINYSKMTDQRRGQVFKKLQVGDIIGEDEKDLLIAYYEQRLLPDSLEHSRAFKLHMERMNRYNELFQSRVPG